MAVAKRAVAAAATATDSGADPRASSSKGHKVKAAMNPQTENQEEEQLMKVQIQSPQR
jgi:hypothetical protein